MIGEQDHAGGAGQLGGVFPPPLGFQDPARLAEAQGLALTPEVIRTRAYPSQPDPQTSLQHGYLQNQFGRMFGQLADVYGHIFRVGHGEIDLADVVLNRRLLVVMLPPLEKSPDELASLGKLLIASLKTMLAIGLGAGLEGRHRAVIESRPMAAPAPYLGVFDEYGYYAVKGFAVVPAQARSLGFAVCFGGQDLQSFGKESQEEAAAIVANTLTKAAMFIEDPKDTAELFEKLGGQALTVQTSGYTKSDHTLLASLYRDALNAGFERRSRIDPLDLREQVTGEAHVFRGTTIVRAHLFFAGNFKAQEYRLNRFVPLGPFDATEALAHRDALTPDRLRQAVARVVTPPLDAVQRASLRALLASGSLPDDPPAADRALRHTFAQRWIDAYLQEYAALDTEGAEQLWDAAEDSTGDPAGVVSSTPEPVTRPALRAEAARSSLVEECPPPVEDALDDPLSLRLPPPQDSTAAERPPGDWAAIRAAVQAALALRGTEESLRWEPATTVSSPMGYLGAPVEQPDEEFAARVARSQNIQGREDGGPIRSLNPDFPRRAASPPRRLAVDRLESVDFAIHAEQAHAEEDGPRPRR
jgi:hypothetical protein